MNLQRKNRSFRKSIALLMITLVFVGSGLTLMPARASAQWAVADFLNAVPNILSEIWGARDDVKEYVLDPLLFALVNTMVDSIKQSTINWARNGFDGKPAFVTDMRRNLRDLQDAVTESFFYELEAQGKVKSPFLTRIATQVRENYYRGTQENALAKLTLYTLDGVCAEHEAFLSGDFAACGIEGWITAWRNPWNNPIGAQISAEQALGRSLATAATDRVREIELGSGFLSKRECRQAPAPSSDVSLSTAETGYKCKIVTPGAVIQDQLQTALGSDIARLVSADELDEVLATVAANLITGTLDDLLNDDSDPNPGGGPVPPTISTNFLNAVEQQLQNLANYRANWEKIRGAVVQANEQLRQCSSRADEEDVALMAAALEEADTALTNVAGATAALSEFRARVVAARNQEQFQTLSMEYQALQSSGVLPSATDFARAAKESQAVQEDAGFETLFSAAVRIARSGCSIFNGNNNN